MSLRRNAAVLYLSYDGMTDPLGPSQVLAYLVELAKIGHSITLISFEKPERRAEERRAIEEQCMAAGIDWHPLSYTKRPPVIAKLRDLNTLWRLMKRLNAEKHFDIVHCRSYMMGLLGARLKSAAGTKFIFDMRGFWADERVEGGLWKLNHPVYGPIYRWLKRQEKKLLAAADQTVVLTHAAEKIMRRDWGLGDKAAISVIPCCVDIDAFPPIQPEQRAKARERLNIGASAPVAVYLGSIGTWYMLAEMLDFFAVQLRRNHAAVMLFVSRDAPEPILAAAAERGIPPDAIRVQSATRAEVPHLLATADYGLFFIRPTFSKQASSPVKLGELMAVGLPVVTNAGVGDCDQIITETGAGVLVPELSEADYGRALDELASRRVDESRRREGLAKWFDLAIGVGKYDTIYQRLTR